MAAIADEAIAAHDQSFENMIAAPAAFSVKVLFSKTLPSEYM